MHSLKLKNIVSSCESLNITRFISYREFLKKLYHTAKEQITSYSYYKFAEDLTFSKSNVIWLTITGKRKLTKKSGEKIAKSLNFNSMEKNYLYLLIDYNNTSRPDLREDIFQKIVELSQSRNPSERLEYFSEWYHPVIREMTGLDDFQSDPQWVCSKLCVRVLPKQVKESLLLLEELNLIEYDAVLGRHVRTDEQILPDRETQNFALVRYHQKMSEIARDSLVKVEEKRRDYNAVTLCIKEETAMKISSMIYKTIEKIMEIEGKEENPDQVYQLNLQLFPFTNEKESK